MALIDKSYIQLPISLHSSKFQDKERYWPKIAIFYNSCICKVLECSVWCGIMVWLLSLTDKFGSTCVVDGPNTWEATCGHGPGDVRVGWRMMTKGLVA